MMFHNRFFARLAAVEEAPGGAGSGTEGASKPPKVEEAPGGAGSGTEGASKPPKVEARAEEPKPDPILQKLLQTEQRLDVATKELEAHRAKLKAHEREARKSKVLTKLREEFPGLPEIEIRGAALVAAEDGHIDLFAEDPAAAIAHMKTALSPKAKKTPASSTSLGGSPGSPGKPATTISPKFAI